MRALMSMTVTFSPSEAASSIHYPTGEQIAEAMATVGLRPPALARRSDDQALQSSESELLRKLAAVAKIVVERQSQAEDELIRGSSMASEGKPPGSFAALARSRLPKSDPDRETVVMLASYALPVLMRMPARNAEDRERRRLASESLMYASVVTPTRSQFVVSAENESAVTVRMHNQLIERLQNGCEDLLRLLRQPVAVAGGKVQFALDGQIQIYEVGQEDSTITGHLVGFTTKDRLRDLRKTNKVSAVVASLLAIAFLALFLLLLRQHIHHGTTTVQIHESSAGHSYYQQSDQFWLGEAERLQSGVLPVLLVTSLTLLIKYPRKQEVRWTQLLRAEPGSDSSA
jgi:hypothetical protein